MGILGDILKSQNTATYTHDNVLAIMAAITKLDETECNQATMTAVVKVFLEQRGIDVAKAVTIGVVVTEILDTTFADNYYGDLGQKASAVMAMFGIAEELATGEEIEKLMTKELRDMLKGILKK